MLLVEDIMRTDVVTVSTNDTARTLARVLADSEISGTPVVDSGGRVVGVVSSTDLVRLAADEADVNLTTVALRVNTELVADLDEDTQERDPDPFGFFLPEDTPLIGTESLDQFPETSFDTVTVGDLMTPVTFSVAPKMPVAELCGFLVRGRIHRALVLSGDALVGIVTSQDVMAAVADGRIGG